MLPLHVVEVTCCCSCCSNPEDPHCLGYPPPQSPPSLLLGDTRSTTQAPNHIPWKRDGVAKGKFTRATSCQLPASNTAMKLFPSGPIPGTSTTPSSSGAAEGEGMKHGSVTAPPGRCQVTAVPVCVSILEAALPMLVGRTADREYTYLMVQNILQMGRAQQRYLLK